MADAKTPRRTNKPTNPEAQAFGVITMALEELPTEVVHRVLDHAAKMYGFYVVTDLPELSGNGAGAQLGPVERTYDPPVGADPHAG